MSFALLLGVAHAQANLAPRAMPAGPYPDERRILDLLNQERQRAGLQRLSWDQHAAEAAREHSILMAASLEIGHQFPGEPALSQRIAATGARFTGCAENVAVGGGGFRGPQGRAYRPGLSVGDGPHGQPAGLGWIGV